MGYSYIWPSSLPQVPQKGYTETHDLNVVSTSMDAGPTKTRYRGKAPNTLSVSFILTTQQLSTLESFVVDTLKGTSRFGFKHPRTGSIVEVRVVPSGKSMFRTQYLAPGYYRADMQLEVLP